MLRRSHILTAVVVLAMCVVPGLAYGMPDQPVAPSEPAPPPSSIAQSEGQAYQDLRSPDARDAGTQLAQNGYKDLRSPDAKDAAGTYAEPTTQVAQDLRSPDARDAALPEAPTPDTVVEIREVPGNGFDWGDAGIGAAGLLALLSIAGGLTLMVTTRRRRHGTEMPAH